MVILTDELQAIAQELVRGDYLDRVHIGLDFFDASINRVAAWVIGTRNAQGAADRLLEPTDEPEGARRPRATTRAGSRCSKSSRRCRSARSGTITALPRTPRPAWRGTTASCSMRRTS